MKTELLTPEEFDAHTANRTLRLSFVGMSNCGKSYRSKVLAHENDFFWHRVDGDIQKSLDLESEEEIASWLGYPTSPTYHERERKYIKLENEFTGRAAMSSPGKNIVFDTTGSVIHLDQTVLNLLRDNTLVVHLDVGEESLESLIAQFFQMPKPIAWSGYFTQAPGESEESALRRCYPILLKGRLRRYSALAHININARELYDMSGDKTLEIIRGKLKTNMI
jgi:shikimate kinase